ncbi:MAG: glycosyltransferase family 1 protein [Deltaproteobacteria bacterium]|nr:MAG: glycosyltransferase family 1 protein [Deltaproteobacteria bacterium]
MRVLHLDAAAEWRGGQTQLRLLLRHAPGTHGVMLPKDAPLRPKLDEDGARICGDLPHGWLASARPLKQAITLFEPEMIAAHTPQAHALAVRAAGALPVIVHRRVDFAPGTSPLTRARYRAAQGYVCVSEAVRRVLLDYGVPPERALVVRDGVEVSAHRPDPEGAARLRASLGLAASCLAIGAVGALVPHKGHRVLIEAMAWLRARRPDVVALIAGEGKARRSLQAQIDRLGAPVRLLGQLSAAELRGLHGAIELLVHPSIEEGLGQAVIEAMAAGVPVIASDAGGLAEIVRPGETGRLVPPDHPDALAETLHHALLNRSEGQRMALEARSFVRHHLSAEGMAQRTTQAYQKLLLGAATDA